ncbi:dihydrofolate reductase family protein [Actinomycetospora lutea]|uniref:dihydrofolate reductase family protein n=1 Tax=Actinomycetospora lutea TaxID=663604 RepID=UPI002366677A|nr:dihydrofolate reductase family protein [Actinomycetospora lutea]MDD7936934.1 dihydrofolate reductase family protein [Actinomycetospora lutea]
MSKIVLCMWMSLDGFIAGPEDGPGQGLGIGGERLHDFVTFDGPDHPAAAHSDDEVGAAVMAELMTSGAVLTGRRTYDLAGGWGGDHHDGVPIIVLTRSPGPASGLVRPVADVREAAARAREAAGDKDVLLHGASAARAFLLAGEIDEMALQIVPVLLGRGRRLFGDAPGELPPEQVELELVHSAVGPGMVHLRYRVLREGGAAVDSRDG